MGGVGIEYRDPNSLMNLYSDNNELPNYSIWNGTRLCISYDGGNVDEGMQKLQNFLNMIQSGGTQTIYTIRFYDISAKNIKSGTPYSASTTFQLTQGIPSPQNMPIIVSGPQQQQQQRNNDSRFIDELKELRKENRTLQQRLYDKQIEQVRADFANQIAGLKAEDKQHPVIGFFDKLLDKHGDKILETVSGLFKGSKNYIQENPNPGSVNGSTKTETDTEKISDMKLEYTNEGALINPFLTVEQQKLKRAKQGEILLPILKAMDDDGQDDIQSECLAIIEKRISNVTLTRMLLSVACLDNGDLNKLLTNLD